MKPIKETIKERIDYDHIIYIEVERCPKCGYILDSNEQVCKCGQHIDRGDEDD